MKFTACGCLEAHTNAVLLIERRNKAADRNTVTPLLYCSFAYEKQHLKQKSSVQTLFLTDLTLNRRYDSCSGEFGHNRKNNRML
jgi:hypothetical protein